jgi:transposase-like protein
VPEKRLQQGVSRMPKKNSARQTRRIHTSAFKAQVALAAIAGDKTMAQLCAQYAVHGICPVLTALSVA